MIFAGTLTTREEPCSGEISLLRSQEYPEVVDTVGGNYALLNFHILARARLPMDVRQATGDGGRGVGKIDGQVFT